MDVKHSCGIHVASLAMVFVVLALAGCGADEGADEVVVYTSVDESVARPVAERFERETGIRGRLVPDTEETKSTGLVNRLIAEKARPRADVFWSGDPMRAALLKRKGVSAAYRSAESAELPVAYSDPESHWTGFSARARVIIFNRELVPEATKPRSVFDLLKPELKGRVCIANPLFGTTSMHAAALFLVLGEERAREWFEGFARNGGRILSSNGEVRRRVANGEFAVGLTDTDDAHVAKMEGKPVAVVYPDADGMGTVIVPNCAVLIAGGPNPDAGRRFIDHLLRARTEEALARSAAAQMPLRPDVPAPAGMTRIASLHPMEVDYAELATLLERLLGGYLLEWVQRNL